MTSEISGGGDWYGGDHTVLAATSAAAATLSMWYARAVNASQGADCSYGSVDLEYY